SRRYWDNTLILETRFETATGDVALIDFMPPRGNASDVVRLVRGVRGTVKMKMQLVIRFGFGSDVPWVRRTEEGAILAICGQDMTLPLPLAPRRHVHAARADELRLHRRGGRVAQLAVARSGGSACQHANHVRYHGSTAAVGMGGGLVGWL